VPVDQNAQDTIMKRVLCGLVVLAFLATAMDPAFARRGGRGGGTRSGAGAPHHPAGSGPNRPGGGGPPRLGVTQVIIGGGYGYLPWSGPWYLTPRLAVFAPEPAYSVTYIERDEQDEPAGPAPTYWYYCPEVDGYYPEVQACPDGWQELVSHAP